MEASSNYLKDGPVQTEIRNFVNEGLQDVYNNNLLDFDTVFNELEERYSAHE